MKSGNFNSKQMYNIYDHSNDDSVYNTNDDYRIKMLICKYIQQNM